MLFFALYSQCAVSDGLGYRVTLMVMMKIDLMNRGSLIK